LGLSVIAHRATCVSSRRFIASARPGTVERPRRCGCRCCSVPRTCSWRRQFAYQVAQHPRARVWQQAGHYTGNEDLALPALLDGLHKTG
jgi:hypothetical protein